MAHNDCKLEACSDDESPISIQRFVGDDSRGIPGSRLKAR